MGLCKYEAAVIAAFDNIHDGIGYHALQLARTLDEAIAACERSAGAGDTPEAVIARATGYAAGLEAGLSALTRAHSEAYRIYKAAIEGAQ